MKRKASVSLDALLASKEMVLVTGSGGVGKTTVAAAMGLSAAINQGSKGLLCTNGSVTSGNRSGHSKAAADAMRSQTMR